MTGWEKDADALLSSGARHILLLSPADAARGQIAEAIARALAPRRVRISSAGMVRAPRMDPLAARALAELSVDTADQHSKTVDEVELDDVDAVITLAEDVTVPAALSRALRIDWPLPDPAARKGPDEERIAAYRSVRNELRRRFLRAFARDVGRSTTAAATTTFEPAAGGDFEAIRAILAAALLPSREIGLPNQRFVVARQAGRIIGCAGIELHGANGLGRSIAVDWTRRNAGLGTRLHDRLLDTAVAAGVRTLYVITTTAEDFFARHGYQRIGLDAVPREVRDSEEFRTLAPGDAAAMSRPVEKT